MTPLAIWHRDWSLPLRYFVLSSIISYIYDHSSDVRAMRLYHTEINKILYFCLVYQWYHYVFLITGTVSMENLTRMMISRNLVVYDITPKT